MNESVTQPPLTPRTINLIVGLIRDFCGLAVDQVTVYNQKWKIPNDERMYVSVGLLSETPYGTQKSNREDVKDGRPVLIETLAVNIQETLSINVFSRSQAALNRKEEVLLAFSSQQAEQLCEANSIKLGELPVSFVDLSQPEGVARINRYGLTINALSSRKVERIVQYFDKFQPTGLIINP